MSNCCARDIDNEEDIIADDFLANKLALADGTVLDPSLTFQNDLNAGLYRIGADNLGITVGGVKQVDISTSSTSFTNKILAPSSAASTPGYSFSGDTDTGIGSASSNTVYISTGGVSKCQFQGNAVIPTVPIQFTVGTAGAPSMCFQGDADVGFYYVGANSAGFACGGSSRYTMSDTQFISTIPFRSGDGTVSAPSYSFSSDNNTGLYSIGADNIGISCGGVNQVSVSTTSATFTNRILVPGGSVSSPSIQFSNVADGNGLYFDTAMNFSISGVNRFRIQSNALNCFLPIIVPETGGSASVPTITFNNDFNTGIYRIAEDNIGITTGGTNRLTIGNSSLISSVPVALPTTSTVSTPALGFTGQTNSGLGLLGTGGIGLVSVGRPRVLLNTVAKTLLDATLTNVATLTYSVGGASAGFMEYTVNVTGSGGTFQIECGLINIVSNYDSLLVQSSVTKVSSQQSLNSGTLSCTLGVVNATNVVTLQVNADTSFVGAGLFFQAHWRPLDAVANVCALAFV